MALLRLTDGSDVTVKLSVRETLAALSAGSATAPAFVELPCDDGGAIHVRPSGVMAIIENAGHKVTGFRHGLSHAGS